RPGRRGQFRHDRENRLPHDVLVVDEASMVSLTMMARLLAAVGDGTRLVLVGDPHQLASVDAGAVLADIAEGLAGPGGTGPGTASGRQGADAGNDRSEPVGLTPAPRAAGDPGVPNGARPGARSGTGVVLLRHIWRFGGGIAALAEAVRAGDVTAAAEVLDSGV